MDNKKEDKKGGEEEGREGVREQKKVGSREWTD